MLPNGSLREVAVAMVTGGGACAFAEMASEWWLALESGGWLSFSRLRCDDASGSAMFVVQRQSVALCESDV